MQGDPSAQLYSPVNGDLLLGCCSIKSHVFVPISFICVLMKTPKSPCLIGIHGFGFGCFHILCTSNVYGGVTRVFEMC